MTCRATSVWAWICVAIGIAALAGCGLESDQIVLRLAETHPRDYPTTEANYEFARLVEERSGGRIRIEVYHSAQLGEEREVIEQVQFGAIDLTRVSISPLSSFVPKLDALQMPFLYEGAEPMWAVLRGNIGREMLETLEQADFVGLNYYDSGARSFYNTRGEFRHPDDMAGLQIRVQESRLMMDLVQALGAVATPMPFGEVYSALQTGVIDGAENNWPSYYSTSHYEVAPYFSVNEHSRVPEVTIMSRLAMDRLAEEDQQLIRQAAWDAMDYQIERWKAFEAEAEQRIRDAGNTITEREAIDVDAFRERVQPLYDRLPEDQRNLVERIRDRAASLPADAS